MFILYWTVFVNFIISISASGKWNPCNGNNWIYHNISGKCFQVLEYPMSWSLARKECHYLPAMNGFISDLAIIESKEENDFVASLLNEFPKWLGLSLSENENAFVWTNGGEVAQFKNFGHKEPNNSNNKEHCIEILKTSGKWNDANCLTSKYGVCQQHKNWLAESNEEKILNYCKIKDPLGRTCLMNAVMMNNLQVIKKLLKHQFDIEAKDYDGSTSLIYAATYGHLEVVRLLLSHGANITATNVNGYTSLLYASRNGHTEVVKLLLKNGAKADINSKDFLYGETAMMLAARFGHIDVVHILLDNNADVNHMNWDKSFTARDNVNECYDKCSESRCDEVKILLDFKGAKTASAMKGYELENKHNMGLMTASFNGDAENVKEFLRKGAYVDFTNGRGKSSLIYAAQNGYKDVVNLLLEKNANVEAKDNASQTSLMYAAGKGHQEIVKLLLQFGANINAKDYNGYTSLILANWYQEVVKILLENGAKVDDKDSFGKTSLIWAAKNGNEDVVKILIENNANIEAKDTYGKTSLMYAASNAHLETVKVLLENGVKTEERDDSGLTAREMAQKCNYKYKKLKDCAAVAKLLKEYGIRAKKE